jgi:hypothetical protein
VTDKQCNHVAANWVWLAKQEYAAKDRNKSYEDVARNKRHDDDAAAES